VTTAAGLLHEILVAPEDDAPRLVYADWLDEHARSDADRARAELIRVECQAARLPDGDERREQLEARAGVLEEAHLDEWAGPLRPFLGGGTPRFQRGFPWVVIGIHKFIAGAFQEMAAEWFPRAGVLSLRLTNPGSDKLAKHMPAAVASPVLSGLHTLSVWRVKPGDEGLKLLAGTPSLANLRELELALPHCSDTGLGYLAESDHLQGLRVLTLDGASWGPTPVTVNGLRPLLGSRLPHLTTLRLTGSAWSLEGKQGQQLRELPGLARLHALNLWSNLIGDEGARTLAGCPLLTNLRELFLARNQIRDEGMLALTDSPHLRRLELLDVRENRKLKKSTEKRLQERFGAGLCC
jgi:uncharacterized protein (TIGR02996 family)